MSEYTAKKVIAVQAYGTPLKVGSTYETKVMYLLEDRSEVHGRYNSRLKRDALPGVHRMHLRAKAGMITARFRNGKFIGITQVFQVGGVLEVTE
jgi:hypothetical protein